MKIYKRQSDAYRAAGNSPILMIRSKGQTFYVVGVDDFTEVNILGGSKRGAEGAAFVQGSFSGTVTLHHLNRLGNANHAIAKLPMYTSAFTPRAPLAGFVESK